MLIFLSVILPIVSGLCLLNPKIKRERFATVFTVLTALLVMVVNLIKTNEVVDILRFPMGLSLSFKADELSILFSFLFVIVWVLVTIYSFEYMSHGKEQRRFQAFFLATLGGLLGVAYADNLFTMYMFFEITSIFCYVLVVHDRTKKSIQAGRKFIYYSLGGAGLGLLAIFYVYSFTETQSFIAGGLQTLPNNNTTLVYLLLAIIGFGCKAGMFPLHGWLSTAHPEAPAPASSVLSGLVTKAGIIAIIRVVYYTVGVEVIKGTWLQYTVIALALATIFMGSMLAYLEKNMKKRFAYSTVSQVSYIILALFLLSEVGIVGAILQIVYHIFAKNILFLVAGIVIYKTGKHKICDLEGLGGRFKSTFIAFTVASLSLVGVPLTGGFISKWYIAKGALEYGGLGLLCVSVVMISAVLTAGYLFTIVANTMFCEKEKMCDAPEKVSKKMIVPITVLAIFIIVLGVYPTPLIEFATNLAKTLV